MFHRSRGLGEGDEVKRKYGELQIAMAMEDKHRKPYILGLSKSGQQLKERIDNVMKDGKRCFGRLASVCIVGSMVLLNSLTVFAYEDIQFEYVEKGSSDKYLEDILNDDVEFIPGGEEEEKIYSLFDDLTIDINVIYDLQFTDSEGSIYPTYENTVESYASCNHNYVVGTYQEQIRMYCQSCPY